MKTIITLLVIILFVSCLDSKRPPSTTKSVSITETSSKTNSPFNEDNFEIIPRDNWSITQEADTFNSYQYKDLDKQIFYRINVLNHSRKLTSLGINSFDERYLENYFKEYILNLQRDKWDFYKGTYLNRPAVYCDFFITNDLLVNRKEALSKIKMVTLLNANKSYTLSVICRPELIDSVFTSFINSFKFIDHKTIHHFISKKYNYQIVIPPDFSIREWTNPHIDLKLTKTDGTNILINVTKREAAEYNITAHDYSKEMFEREFKQSTPNNSVSKAEKIYISGEKAFLINYQDPKGLTKAIEIYFYRKNFAFVLTGTTSIEKFEEFENVFINTCNSLKFN
jgi:hypothetical protein